MITNRARFILSICLLAALTEWTINRFHPRTNVSASAAKVAESPAPVAEAVVRSSPVRESSVETSRPFAVATFSEPGFDVSPADEEAALANPESPRNSQDFDQNRHWARDFPAEASAWLLHATNSPQRDVIAEIACSQLAETNATAAVALAEQCAGAGSDIMHNLLDNLAQTWAAQDEQAAFAWAAAKPPGDERDRLMHRISFVESKTDPKSAAQMVVEQISPGELQDEAAMSVLNQWAQQDATAALDWAQSFPAGDFRNRAIAEVQNVKAFSSERKAVF